MKRKYAIILCALIIALCVAAFVGCKGRENNNTNNNSVLLFDGATIDEDNKIEITVDKDVTSVKLVDKITLKPGYTWKLYADKMGLVEIPAKIAANILTAELLNGDNEFWIIVSSSDDKETIVYELTVFRNHDVYVNYEYNGRIVKTDTVETNSSYAVSVTGNEDFFDNGFVFNGWKDKDGNKVTTINIEKESVVLTADLTGKTTTVTLNADGGDIASTTATITYGQVPTLPVPTKEGYSFTGWYVDDQRLTDDHGEYIGHYSEYKAEIAATAQWNINTYLLSIDSNTPFCEIGRNSYFSYQAEATASAVTSEGYTWIGWFENDELVSTDLTYNFNMPARNVTLTAKWNANVYTLTLNANGGDCEQTTYSVTYRENYSLPVPTKQGCTFSYWEHDGYKVTDDCGESLFMWDIVNNATLIAHYTFIDYIIQLDYQLIDCDWSPTVALSIYVDDTYCGSNSAIANIGQRVVATAQVHTNLQWLGWYDGDTLIGSGLILDLTMPAKDLHLQARWVGYSVGEIIDIDGKQTVLMRQYLNIGDSYTAKAPQNVSSEEKCYVWIGWFCDDKLLTTDYNYTHIMKDKSVTLVAKIVTVYLQRQTYTTVKIVNGNNEQIRQQMKVGDTVTLCTSSEGDVSAFKGWYDSNNTLVSSDVNYSITLTDKHVVLRPVWATSSFTLHSDDENIYRFAINSSVKSVTPSQEHEFIVGTDVSVYIYEEYYNVVNKLILGWFIDDELVSTDRTYSFKMPETPFELQLKSIKYPITAEPQSPSQGTASGPARIHFVGETAQLSAYANMGYRFSGWYLNGELISTDSNYTVTLSTEKATYVARFISVPGGLNDLDFIVKEDGYAITGLKTSGIKTVVIPDTVTEIADDAFYSLSLDNINSSIEELVLPSTIQKIGKSAFGSCYNLKTVRYKGSLADWCAIEFGQSQNVLYRTEKFYVNDVLISENLVLPEGVTEIKPYAFYGFKVLKSITLPSSMRTVGNYAFRACVNVGKITLNDGLQTIGDCAFSLCHKMTSITIPSSVTSLNYYAFMECRRLVEICDNTEGHLANRLLNVYALRIYSDGESYINTDANGYVFFDDPTSDSCVLVSYVGKQTNITLPTNHNGKQYSINNYAFSQLDMTSVIITEGVTDIAKDAFFACKNLTTVSVNGVNSIGDSAFASCYNLTSFTVSGSPSFGTQVFNFAYNLTNIQFNGLKSDWEQLTKSETWNKFSGVETITCTDGIISLTETA